MEFKQSVIEALQYYVYCLVDPRDNKIFYVGKGCGNRVFQHAEDSLNEDHCSLKLDTIREIRKLNQTVLYYIVRHGMTEAESLLVESVLINVLTYDCFNLESVLTNIQSGHHQWDKGIKTIEEVNALYDCEDLVVSKNDKLICININKTYDNIGKSGEDGRIDIYDATKKYWKINEDRAIKAEYVLATYRGIVRAVFKPTKWVKSEKEFNNGSRWEFEGTPVINSPFLNKSVKKYIKQGNRNPIKYINI